MPDLKAYCEILWSITRDIVEFLHAAWPVHSCVCECVQVRKRSYNSYLQLTAQTSSQST